jgi:hypothetical protein
VERGGSRRPDRLGRRSRDGGGQQQPARHQRRADREACRSSRSSRISAWAYETVDVAAASARGIKGPTHPTSSPEEVADLAIALVLATLRRIPQGDRYVREGKWLKGAMPPRRDRPGQDPGDRRHGPHRPGDRKRGLALNMEIAYQGPNRKGALPYRYFADPVALATESGRPDGRVPRWRRHEEPGEPRGDRRARVPRATS